MAVLVGSGRWTVGSREQGGGAVSWKKVLEKGLKQALYGAVAAAGGVVAATPAASAEEVGAAALAGLLAGVIGALQNWLKH